jgi:hypothetical protein
MYTFNPMGYTLKHIKSENKIRSFFENAPSRVFSPAELARIIEDHRNTWNLAATTPVAKLIDRLVANNILSLFEIPFSNEEIVQRYFFGKPSAYDIALSLHNKSYLSHYTAVFQHGLTTQVPKTIYVTHEQSAKVQARGTLTQAAIDSDFLSPQRKPEIKGMFEDYRLILLNDRHTNRVGVTTVAIDKAKLSYTDLEKTLIDITVKPNYAGGAFAVLEAYKRALALNLSVNKLAATLNNLSFIYPYHQAVGFYLTRAGYTGDLLSLLRKQPMPFDFYLDYQIEEKGYSPDWKIYFPMGM